MTLSVKTHRTVVSTSPAQALRKPMGACRSHWGFPLGMKGIRTLPLPPQQLYSPLYTSRMGGRPCTHVSLQYLSAGGDLAPEGTFDNVWRYF